MIMAQKQLHELLQEDQEPFQLKSYIADRRCQLKRPSIPKTNLVQVKKRKPISQKYFCKNVCLFSFHNSPDPRKSPLFQYSPPKSPCKSPNAILLHIPARTAAVLLEAAVRVQKQSSSPKSKSQNNGFGLFGTLLNRLTHRNKTRKREIGTGNHGVKASVKEILRWDSSDGRGNSFNQRDHRNQEQRQEHEQEEETIMVDTSISEKCGCEMGFDSCCCNHIGRPNSEVWSEKSLDLDFDTSSSTSQSEEDHNIDNFVNKDIIDPGDFASYDEQYFCDSPFRFVLQRSPSTGCRTPDFSSPVTSPSRHIFEGEENTGDVESLKKFQVQNEEEEEKEQCSPVSVLDPPFEDDDDGHENHSEDDGFDLECSYAIVQRAKKQLLQKLRRFEKLAELDPVELESRILEQEEEEEVSDLEEEEQRRDGDELVSSNREKNIKTLILEEILSKSSFHLPRKIQRDMKRLISDLIVEEEREDNVFNREAMEKRICKRLESWKEVESNTIDMMVEEDFRRELDGWKGNREQVEETALEIELGIVGLLVEELSQELVA